MRIPSEADERVRDVVRCRETFQREILKSRHYILKFLARRGFVFREGTNWCTPHLQWLQHLTTDGSPLAPQDRLVFREYHALLMYKLQRRDELDRQIEQLAVAADARADGAVVCSASAGSRCTRRWCWRRRSSIGAASSARRNSRAISGLVSREDSSGDRDAPRLDHEGGQHALSACARPGGVELSASPADERRSQAAASRASRPP